MTLTHLPWGPRLHTLLMGQELHFNSDLAFSPCPATSQVFRSPAASPGWTLDLCFQFCFWHHLPLLLPGLPWGGPRTWFITSPCLGVSVGSTHKCLLCPPCSGAGGLSPGW